MNRFFETRDEPRMPARLHARTIDFYAGEDGPGYVLFDAVDADWFDEKLRQHDGRITSEVWGDLIEEAPIYAVEIVADKFDNGAAAGWLKNNPGRPDDWLELTIQVDDRGPADLYDNINGPAQRVQVRLGKMREARKAALRTATALTASSDADVEDALPSSTSLDRIVVLDVGQGSANAIYSDAGEIVAYVDLGAGVLKNSKTWSKTLMTGFCFCHDPVIILTHWHYDHFNGANKFRTNGSPSEAHKRTWIAPDQPIGAGPQSAMANAIKKHGKLLIWGGKGAISKGALTIESGSWGIANDFDRTGIAAWAEGPNAADPILMPGDAHYVDVPGLCGGRAVTSLVVSHHGGNVGRTKPPTDPNLPVTLLAFSYGDNNTYKHPAPTSITDLAAAQWTIGVPSTLRFDERVTCDLRAVPSLGNIRLHWSRSSGPARSCGAAPCGASVDHNQP